MKRILLMAAVMGAALAARAEDGAKREFPAGDVKEIRIQAESGPIEVRAGEKLEVEVVENKNPELCRLTMEAKDGVLLLKAETVKRGLFSVGDGCGAGFRVSAPKALPLDAKAGSGRILAAGRAGAVTLSAGSGDVVLDGAAGDAELSTGSGRISGTLSGRLTAKSGSGGVRLAWGKAPQGQVEVRSGSGSVALVFPKGTKLQARQTAGSGETANTLGDTPGAPLKVVVTTGSGNSTISSAD